MIPFAKQGGTGISPVFRPLVRVLVLSLVLTGCTTLVPLPPVDLSSPGWTIKRGQGVWKFGEKAPEVVGDLMVAARAGGELFAQFSKGPLTVAVARADGARWELNLSLFDRRIARRGSPNNRFALFQLAREVNGVPPPSPWIHSKEGDGHWRLENPRTGEYVEGYWEP